MGGACWNLEDIEQTNLKYTDNLNRFFLMIKKVTINKLIYIFLKILKIIFY